MATNDPILEQLRQIDPDAEPTAEEWGKPEFLDLDMGSTVSVAHHEVPYLRAWVRDDGSAFLMLDQRFGLELPPDKDLRDRVVHFLAEAIAIGAGRASIERPDVAMPFRGR